MAVLRVDPEWAEIIAPLAGIPQPVVKDPLTSRQLQNQGIIALFGSPLLPAGMEETKHTIASRDGTSIDVYRFVPQAASKAKSQLAVVMAFGGGFIAGSVKNWHRFIADWTEASGKQVFAVDYRLAPENPAPAALEDIYAAVTWLQANASDFDVDPARIVIEGGSAGGGLAAGVALMARDWGLNPPLAGQILRYPMLDDQTTIPDDHPMSPHVTWRSDRNQIAWEAYTGLPSAERNDTNVSHYVAPSRAKDVSGLPRTYIDVGSLDIFRDECVAYAARLAAANVDVEFHLYPGVPHGYDGVGANMKVTKASNENRMRFLSSL
ncbi:Alpha/Beta hydrolase protein [Xylariomycetidae sp. FL2044]|nr:Alpha/Beta hydrolase protein [Xylariomycetidae sp. FL2044]